LEDEGVPTTQISLIRLHTETIKPPRALWVPFELGRPFGIPNDIEFQSKILLSALKLLEIEKGPVIEDFPQEAPPATDQITTIACPVSFEGKIEELSEADKIMSAMKQEIAGLQTWYDMAIKKRGRTTVGLSGMDLDQICAIISEFINGKTPENPRDDISLAYTVNLAIDDLKAYYTEAVTAQPGQESPSIEVLNKWFWTETAASKALYSLRDACLKSEDGMLKLLGMVLIVPVEYARKK
jgi:hypothetical protein